MSTLAILVGGGQVMQREADPARAKEPLALMVDAAHIARITQTVSAQDGIEVEYVSDRTLLLHRGGKLEIASKGSLKTPDDLEAAQQLVRDHGGDPADAASLPTDAQEA